MWRKKRFFLKQWFLFWSEKFSSVRNLRFVPLFSFLLNIFSCYNRFALSFSRTNHQPTSVQQHSHIIQISLNIFYIFNHHYHHQQHHHHGYIQHQHQNICWNQEVNCFIAKRVLQQYDNNDDNEQKEEL